MPLPTKRLKVYAGVIALMAWFAVSLEFGLTLSHALSSGRSLWAACEREVSYFTILTNIFCALVLTAHVLPEGRRRPLRLFRRPAVITSAESSIIVVLVVYHLLLRHLWAPAGLHALADLLLHYAVPFGFSLFWWYAMPPLSLHWADLPQLCYYPLAYGGYVFLRGEFVSRYPYPFLDVTAIGYSGALLNAGALFVGLVGLGVALIAVDGHVQRGRLR